MTQPDYGDATPAFTPPQESTDEMVRRVKVRPIELMRRAQQLVGDQFWLFVGITFVGILLGSLVPLGILLGPMMVGIYFCFMDREAGRPTDFDSLFRGFEQFAEALVATLIMIGISFLIMLPLSFILILVLIGPLVAMGQNGGEPPPAAILFVLLFYPIVILVGMLVYLPFLFTYQLIADRQLKAWDAVKLSIRGVLKNLVGVLFHFFVLTLCSFVLTLMCYVPMILFLPISFGSLFVLYRDIYGMDIVDAQIIS